MVGENENVSSDMIFKQNIFKSYSKTCKIINYLHWFYHIHKLISYSEKSFSRKKQAHLNILRFELTMFKISNWKYVHLCEYMYILYLHLLRLEKGTVPMTLTGLLRQMSMISLMWQVNLCRKVKKGWRFQMDYILERKDWA